MADSIDGKSLSCLVAADRFLHVNNKIVPELNKGKVLICDRNILSAFVLNKMDHVNFEYTYKLYDGLQYPDIVVIFHASAETIYSRLHKSKL